MMTAALGGLDALVFTGAVGEGSHRVRRAATAELGFLGVAIRDDGGETGDGLREDISAAARAGAYAGRPRARGPRDRRADPRRDLVVVPRGVVHPGLL